MFRNTFVLKLHLKRSWPLSQRHKKCIIWTAYQLSLLIYRQLPIHQRRTPHRVRNSTSRTCNGTFPFVALWGCCNRGHSRACCSYLHRSLSDCKDDLTSRESQSRDSARKNSVISRSRRDLFSEESVHDSVGLSFSSSSVFSVFFFGCSIFASGWPCPNFQENCSLFLGLSLTTSVLWLLTCDDSDVAYCLALLVLLLLYCEW